jgi:tRNA(fMet)-specific endonuclease VapC
VVHFFPLGLRPTVGRSPVQRRPPPEGPRPSAHQAAQPPGELHCGLLSLLSKGHTGVVKKVESLSAGEVSTTIITKIEMLRGRFEYALKAATPQEMLKAYRLLAETEHLLASLIILPFDEPAAKRFDQLQAQRKLRHIGRADLVIASIVLATHAVLVTRNVKHFRVAPGLHVENWAG